jgi:DNA-binding NarL/FixJ family response regulator
LFALAEAEQCLERALVLSKAINSPYWCRLSASFLASVYIHDHRLERAAETLDSAPDPDAPWNTRAQITVWAARVELALADGNSARSLEIAEQLMQVVMPASTAPPGAWYGAPRLQMWYGEALAACGRYVDAEIHLKAALQTAQAQAAAPLEWRVHRALSRCHRSQRHFEAAEDAVIAAQIGIEALAANVSDDQMRQNFLRQATDDLASRPVSARRAAKRAFGGLTAREQQIAVLVGQGKSSPEIAAELVLSERTVEKHISNILNKLGFDRRAQVISWIAEKGFPNIQNP